MNRLRLAGLRAQALAGFYRTDVLSIRSVVTKHYCLVDDMPHREFVVRFFSGASYSELINETDYVRWQPDDERDMFMNTPEHIVNPEWWVMPWLNLKKDLRVGGALGAEKEERAKRYINLIKTVERDGFRWEEGGTLPVHMLIREDGEKVAIILDGHHRLSLASCLIEKNILEDAVPLRVRCHIFRNKKGQVFVYLKRRRIIMSEAEQGLANQWFDLAFSLVGKNQN